MATTTMLPPPSQLSDSELLAQVPRLAARERDATAALIAHLAELDMRRLYLAEGCFSLFTYCTQVLHLSETYAKLRLAQDLLRHQIPDGDVAQVLDRALTVLVGALRKQKLAATDRPRESWDAAPGSRHIPAAVKRAVWGRDGGRCAFVSQQGRRCTERGCLEFHHVRPYAAGGAATAGNIALRCRAHNGYEAERDFGPRPPSVVREPGRAYARPRRVAAAMATRSGPSCGLGREDPVLTPMSSRP